MLLRPSQGVLNIIAIQNKSWHKNFCEIVVFKFNLNIVKHFSPIQ